MRKSESIHIYVLLAKLTNWDSYCVCEGFVYEALQGVRRVSNLLLINCLSYRKPDTDYTMK